MPHIERLQQLRRVVMEAPEDLLHMNAVVEEASCGTARCAIGWAIIDPWFQQNTGLNDILPADWSSSSFYVDTKEWCDGGKNRLGKIAELFGIAQEDAGNLFGSDLCSHVGGHSVSRDEVLWNIDELLAGRSALPYRAVYNGGPYAMGLVNEDEDELEDEIEEG